MGMDQYLLLIPFLGEWTSINPSYELMWTTGVQGFDTLPYFCMRIMLNIACKKGWNIDGDLTGYGDMVGFTVTRPHRSQFGFERGNTHSESTDLEPRLTGLGEFHQYRKSGNLKRKSPSNIHGFGWVFHYCPWDIRVFFVANQPSWCVSPPELMWIPWYSHKKSHVSSLKIH